MKIYEAWVELRQWLYVERACEDAESGENPGSISAWKAYDSVLREMKILEHEFE